MIDLRPIFQSCTVRELINRTLNRFIRDEGHEIRQTLEMVVDKIGTEMWHCNRLPMYPLKSCFKRDYGTLPTRGIELSTLIGSHRT